MSKQPQTVENICEECKKKKDELHVSASATMPSYEEWYKWNFQIQAQLDRITDKYIEIAIDNKDSTDLIKHCKKCYAETLVLNATLMEQRYQHTIEMEIREKMLKL